eukprot:CAMPEP_0179970416 /NCGR_PEP_ID=MMETSP0983-20121128/35271_1 /TAXON_ID=483367 /ORGANISM="non described non described, Strain CCMP 2436" /LENGTH=54 /DNA_ID=CAMNT_0021885049 /DNA_START=13 /DNA_END=173 /DNA_ORIENTATION=+
MSARQRVAETVRNTHARRVPAASTSSDTKEWPCGEREHLAVRDIRHVGLPRARR